MLKKFGTWLAVLAIVVPVILWLMDRETYSITGRTIYRSSIMEQVNRSGSLSTKTNLQVFIDGKALKNPTVSLLRIENSGSKPITTAMYESPIRIRAQNGVTFEKVTKERSSPANLLINSDIINNAVEIKPLLLNPGDQFEISVITSGFTPIYGSDARISNVKAIQFNQAAPLKKTSNFYAAMALASSFCIALAYILLLTSPSKTLGRQLLELLASLGCMIAYNETFKIAAANFFDGSSWTYVAFYLLPLVSAFGLYKLVRSQEPKP